MIETLPPDRSDQPLDEWRLPRTGEPSELLRSPLPVTRSWKSVSINLVSIPQQIPGGRILRKSLNHLLPRPKRGRMSSDVEVDDLPAIVPQDDETKEHSKSNGGTVKKSIEMISRA